MRFVEDFAIDLRYATRAMRRAPAFTAVAVLSLAVGIGANAAIFSVVDVLMLRPLGVFDPDRLVLVETPRTYSLSYSLYESFRDASSPDVAELSAVIRTDRYNVAIGGGDRGAIDGGPVRLALVSGNYFAVLGIGAARGRTLAADDDRPSGPPVAMISDEYWDRRFARSPDVLGRTLTFGDAAYEVVGVAPRGFAGEWIGRPTDVWIPMIRQPQIIVELPVGLRNAGVVVIGRLKNGVTREQGRAALQLVFDREMQAQKLATGPIAVEDGRRGYSPQRRSFSQALAILMSAVGLVLFVACANIANLLIARSETRRREIAVRMAVGAGRARLVRQLLTESVLLAIIGGAVGVLFAQWATGALIAFVRSGPVSNAAISLSMDLDVRPDFRILSFTATLCLVTGVLFGLAPSFRGSRLALAPALVGRGPDTHSARGRFTTGKLLVTAQVAASLVLAIGAGLFVRTLRNLTMQDLGFAREHLLLVWTLPGQTGGRGTAAADFWRAAQDRLASIPGVLSVGATNQGVLNGSDVSNIAGAPDLRIEGEPAAPTGLAGWRSFVTPKFFETMGIPLIAGREFTEADTASSPRGVVVNQAFARHYFGDRDPIGCRVWFPEDTSAPTTIVGVVRDWLSGTPRETLRRPGLTYFSYRDKEAPRRLRTMMLAVRTAGDPLSMVARIRRELQRVDLQLPVLRIDTADEQLGDVLVQERLVTTLSTTFGALSLGLACLGLYGAVAYAVARRTSEIGIRMALGATRIAVVRSILAESLEIVVAGIAIGVPVALATARLLSAKLFGVRPADPLTFGGAVLLIALVATAAAFLPARRASRIDPMAALRCE